MRIGLRGLDSKREWSQINASLVCLESLSNFHSKNLSISPYFRGGNLAALHLKCVIAHKTLFSPSFRCENMVVRMPHFHGENPIEFRVSCATVH